MTDLERYWGAWVQGLCSDPPQAHLQIRKFMFNLNWSVPWEIFSTGISMDFSDFGYKEGGSKEDQLSRVYLNMDEIERVRTKFIQRYDSETSRSAQSCLTARFGNKE